MGAGDAGDRRDAAVYVSFGGSPVGDADTHGGLPLPDGDAAPAGPIFLDGGDHTASGLVVANYGVTFERGPYG